MKTNFEFIDSENGLTTICEIADKNNIYMGIADCHPDDFDFVSQYTGGHIAEGRAITKMLQSQKHEVRAQIQILEHVFGCMKASKNYNPDSNEARLMRRQIQIKKNELAELRCDIENLKSSLKEYIALKDKQYDKYRKQAENN